MSVNRLRLRSDKLGVIFTLNLFGSGTPQKYRLKAAQGLDVDDLASVPYGSGTSGVKFSSVNGGERVIVMRIALNPDVGMGETFQQLRDRVYRAIAAERNPAVKFDLMENNVVQSTISGIISRVEASTFTAQPEIQVTLTCPYFLFTGAVVTDFNLVAFSTGEILIDMQKGNAPTGFQMEVNITNPLTSWGFADPDGEWTFNIVYNFLVGDVLVMNTEPGSLDLYVRRFDSGLGTTVEIGLGDRVEASSFWPILFPGENVFQISVPAGLYEIASVSYFPKFWGI